MKPLLCALLLLTCSAVGCGKALTMKRQCIGPTSPNLNLTVVDWTGQMFWETTDEKGSVQIDVPPGPYNVSAERGAMRRRGRIVVTKGCVTAGVVTLELLTE